MVIDTLSAIQIHYSIFESKNGNHPYSAFVACLQNARKETGRSVENGEKIKDLSHGSWLGAIGYLILLDHIGKCFRNTNKPKPENENNIQSALYYFTDLNKTERDVIYALRCAFDHEFGLFNNSTKQSLRHVFSVHDLDTSVLMELPKQIWNGDYENIDSENVTRINLQALGDLVENIVFKIIELAKCNEIEIILEGGPEALVKRYHYNWK